MKTKKKILIVAGGTGGHIVPALCIANSLKAMDAKLPIEFVHGFSPLEKKIYSKSSFLCHRLTVSRLQKNVPIQERLKTICSLPFILIKALILIIKIKPSLVFGTGGAVSGPMLLAAFLLRKKVVIFEPNIIPGLANYWISYFADVVIVVFNKTKTLFNTNTVFKTKKIIQFPLPVHTKIYNIPIKNKPDTPLRVLILGGSQGSSVINKVVSEFIVCNINSGFSFVHQAGEQDFNSLKKMYLNIKSVRVFSFLHTLYTFYEWADIIISRAGTGSIAEISASKRAGIFIPFRYSSNQHQLKNAQDLETKSAAIVIPEKDFNKHKLQKVLIDLKQNPYKVNKLSANIHKLNLGSVADSMSFYLKGL